MNEPRPEGSVFNCPEVPRNQLEGRANGDPWAVVNYGINAGVSMSRAGHEQGLNWMGWPLTHRPYGAVEESSETFLVADVVASNYWAMMQPFGSPPYVGKGKPAPRHAGNAPMAFMDGHAEARQDSELVDPTTDPAADGWSTDVQEYEEPPYNAGPNGAPPS
jgi:prepilin-type processing-associated H-X9-DG protein